MINNMTIYPLTLVSVDGHDGFPTDFTDLHR